MLSLSSRAATRGVAAIITTFLILGALALAGPAAASQFTDTTASDFSAGTTGPGTYVSETADGEVILAPAVGSEFFGSTLPSGWFKSPWSSGGDATVSGGQLTVDGARAGTTATYGSGRVLEYSATFSAATAFAHIGLGTDYNAPPWAMFSVKSDGNLYSRSDNGSGGVVETQLSPLLLGTAHVFRIEWQPTEVRYYADGALVATHSISFGAAQLRVLASDFTPGGGGLAIDWMRMTPYANSGSFNSRVLDAGEIVEWGALNWTADQPAGTSVALNVRTGDTPVPDGSWSTFAPIGSPGDDVSGNSRYAQYRAELNSADSGITPSLNDVTVHYLRDADVSITKTAAPSNARPGEVVTYSLKARNLGDKAADNVVITDSLPVGLSFISADAPCVEATGTVTCAIGSLDPGEEHTYQVKVKVDSWGTANTTADHLLDIQKVEAQIDLEAGELKTVSVTCPSGYFASDGSVRIDHIDQGTGDWTTPQVLESRASSLDTWKGTVKNTATGRAQAKIFAVCIEKKTVDGTHSHDLIVSDPVTVSHAVLAGDKEAILPCGPGQVAIQPGFESSEAADLVYSQPEGNGWKFILDVKADANVTFSIRCMTRQVSLTDGHTHDLKLERIATEVTIQGHTVNEAQLTCADGSKGIVAGWDLDHGLVSLGNDPRPVTRAFKLYNPTDNPLKARLSLLCLGLRTGGEHLPPKTYVNTAMISTSSEETQTGNNSSSATVIAEDTDNHTPVTPVPPVKPVPNNPVATTRFGGGVFLKKSGVTGTITCTAACSGKAKLVSLKAVKIKGKKTAKGILLAAANYKLNAAGTRKLTLKVKGKKAKQILKKIRKGQIKLSNGSKRTVRIRH